MNKKAVAFFVMSISSLSIWELLAYTNIISGKTQSILVLLSLVPLVYYSYKLLNDYKFENNYFKFIFSLFLIYELILVIRGWSFSYIDLRSYLHPGYVLWPFVIPLFVFFDKKPSTIVLLIKWIYFIGLFFLFFYLIFPTLLLKRGTAETLVSSTYVCGFVLLNAKYLSNKRVTVIFILILISLLSLIYVARRNGIVTISGFILAGYFINILTKSRSVLFRLFPLIIICAIFFLVGHSNFTSNLTMKLTVRLKEDTRSGLFEMYFLDMSDYMIFGKGMNGDYYFPMEESVSEDGVIQSEVIYRNVIENGYLQLLLTGGIVHIVLFLLLLLPAAILGIFKSSNQFTLASGVLILLWLLDMFIFGLPRLSLHYIVVWICVGICFKPSIRRMTNDEILKEFQKAKLI
jgi:hypothetical protein